MERDKKMYQKMVVRINFIVGFFLQVGRTLTNLLPL